MMETRDIYREIYTNRNWGNPSFDGTLSLIQDLLLSRLMPGYRNIWVQGSNSGRTRLIFTVFENGREYRMLFLDCGSMRQFVPGGNIESEIVLIENFIETLRTGILNDIIS